MRLLRQPFKIDRGVNGRLAQRRLANRDTRWEIRQVDENHLVQTSWSLNGGINDVGPIGGPNEEDLLGRINTVHLGQQLIHDTIAGATCIATRATTCARNRIQLVKKQNAGRSVSRLIKHIAHIGLTLAKPHGQQFWSLDADEVGRALRRNRLREQSLAAARRTPQQTASRRRLSILGVDLGVLDRVLHHLDHVLLGRLQTANILPFHIGNLHRGLANRRRRHTLHGIVKMILLHAHRIQNVRVNLVRLNINEIELLSNAIHRRLCTQLCQIRTHKTMRRVGNRLQINLVRQLHVARMNVQDFQSARRVRHAHLNLAIKSTKSTQCRINHVHTIRGTNHHHLPASFEAIHEGQQHRHDTTLQFAIRLVSLGRNTVNLVDEDNGRRILLRLLKRLAQIGLRVARHLTHDLWTIDEEEEGASLVGHRLRQQRLTRARRTIQQDSARRFHTQVSENGRMSQWQLDHFAHHHQRLACATNIIIAHLVHVFFVLAFNWIAVAMNEGLGRHNAHVLVGVVLHLHLNHFELDGTESAAHQKIIALLHGAITVLKVRLEVRVKQGASNAVHRVLKRQHMNTIAILDLASTVQRNDIAEFDAQVLANDAVHANLAVVRLFVGQSYAHC
mmetsp:Transcript_18095/g.28613  ORF Transcript_18095/g.28613 Transcript_18095/m.28613 type:complete len:619 (-) Transcript_18095:383-2239(-)